MTTGITLFGGLIAVLVVFFVARMLKAGAELAGLLAAGVPLLAYMTMLFGQWPGLDVVAIHFSVFIASAFILAVFSRYRTRPGRMHWVPKILIGFFVVLAVINASLLYVATNGLPGGIAGLFLPGNNSASLHTGFSGTTRHGQEAAKSIGADLTRQHRNNTLGWQVRLEGLRQPMVGANSLYISAEDRGGKPLQGLVGNLSVNRPGSKAVEVPIMASSPGQYEARITLPGTGLWVVELELRDQKQSWKQSWDVEVIQGAVEAMPGKTDGVQ